jgi:hypothetical protein
MGGSCTSATATEEERCGQTSRAGGEHFDKVNTKRGDNSQNFSVTYFGSSAKITTSNEFCR